LKLYATPNTISYGAFFNHIPILVCKHFENDFIDALKGADGIIVTNVYAARETADKKVNPAHISDALYDMGKEAYFMTDFYDIAKFLSDKMVDGDVLITLGAGDICNVCELFLEMC